jgi:subtilisin family serine protease
MRKLFSWVFVGILAAAAGCSTSTGSDPGDGDEIVPEDEAPPADDVIDESAGEDALAVLQGEQPGVVIIVEFAEGSDVDLVTDALAEQYGLVVTSRYHDLGGAAFIAPDQSIAEQVRLDLRVIGVTNDRLVAASPGDEFASEVDGFMAEATASGESDVDAAAQTRSTGWRLIGTDRAPGNGSGVRVAVIDTGMDLKHPDLKGAYASGYGKDCVRRKNKTLMDKNGHGSHVSGIIAAQNNSSGVVGVAPGARIVPVRVLNAEGSGSFSAVLCGIDYVARRADRIQVANLSLGADCGGPCEFGAPHHKGLRKLWGRGVTVVVAAGNEGIDANESDPAFIDELITVSAYMDGNGKISSKDRYANFSNWGPGVDIGAPGVNILSTVPGKSYEKLSGTSMAAPFVAGVAAIIEQTHGGAPRDIWLAMAGASLGSYPGRGGRHPEGLLRMPGAGTAGTCGNAICDDGEDDDSCAADCGCAANACVGDAPAGCSCETDCTGEACCSDSDICPIM